MFLGREGMSSGPSLTFISLPKVFAAMGGVGRLVGVLFFLALGFAALTSCVKEPARPTIITVITDARCAAGSGGAAQDLSSR